MNETTADFALPELRSDLQLIEGPVALDGSPSWLIVDPLRNRYFSIGWVAFQLLSRWSLGKSGLLIKKIKKDTTLSADDDDIKTLIEFLYSNSLTRYSASGSAQDYFQQYKSTKPNFLVWLIHHYLFFKIPLLRPTRFLRKTLVYVEPVFSITFRFFIFSLGLIGLLMVNRQWDEFTSTFLYFFNVKGLVFYGFSLVFIKVMHEFAHAYTVIRYGCKVPTMGIAFLVMFPILYTDTSDSWRIKAPRERINIGAAGIMVEFYIACIATFCWSFLPDGYLKSAAFIMATTSWVMSLAINLNFLMRFDGYYILSDLLGVQNLQARSFAIGKWRLTELLFGLKLKPPEVFPRNLRSQLTIYAWCVWVYRFILFIGIALLVYHFFFKVLGIFLFFVEIVWFIILPIVNLSKRWWELRDKIVKTRRFYITTSIFFLLLMMFFLPWRSSIAIPAVFQSSEKITLYSSAPAYIEKSNMRDHQHVNKGDALIELSSPRIEQDIIETNQKIDLLRLQAKRMAASDKDLANVQVILTQLQESRSRLKGLIEKQDQLIIKAPFDGVLFDVADSLHNGRWVNENLAFGNIVNTRDAVFEGILEEEDLFRIKLQAQAKFIPDMAEMDSILGFVSDIEQTNLKVLDLQELSSVYGGAVPSFINSDNKLIPKKSLFRIRFKMSAVEERPVTQVLRGVVHVEAEAESLFLRTYKLVGSVLVRESGF